MSKHAYLITFNNNYQVLSACLRMIDRRENDIFILGDKKVFKKLEDVGECLPTLSNANLRILEPMIINWGAYSQIDAELVLMKAAIKEGADYSYLHFLQNSDLPVKSQDEIFRYFDSHQGIEFVNVDPGWEDRVWRAQYRFYFCQNRWCRNNIMLKGLNLFVYYCQRLFNLKTNDDISMYVGSALFSITLPCAKYLVSTETEIKRRFKWSYCGDEIFIQTMIMNSPFADKLMKLADGQTNNAVLVDWQKPHRHNSPRLWRKEDFNEIIEKSSPDFCFARKFIGDIDMEIVTQIEHNMRNRSKYCYDDMF